MIYFGVPLRSKASSGNWENVERLFDRTLKSLYGQTSPHFKIIVACHDMPKLSRQYDERVEFLTADTPIPRNPYEMLLDKGWKISMIARRIKSAGGGYTMLVDSDDLVSNRIAEYADLHPGRTGFLSKYGYIYYEGSGYVKKAYALQRICGSCSIVNYAPEDLPDHMPDNLWDDSLKDKWIIRMPHQKVPVYLAGVGRKLETLPFPSTIYVRGTGDNHSMLEGIDLNWKRRLEMLARRKIKPENGLGKEFGLE